MVDRWLTRLAWAFLGFTALYVGAHVGIYVF